MSRTASRQSFAAAATLLVAVLAALLLASGPARASADVSIQGYDNGGGFIPVGNGGSIPVGATLEIRVWVDLYACDPVTVRWGDGTTSTHSYGGSFAQTFTHTYDTAGTYTISASEPCGGSGNTGTINVGGGGFAIFDPSSEMFVPTLLGLIFGLMAIAMAFGGPRVPPPKPVDPAAVPPPRPRPRLAPGIPADMVQHMVSYRDVPVGAPLQPDPRIAIEMGTPTDISQRVHCRTCGGPLGFVAGGWFCLNPQCPLRQPIAPGEPWPRPVHGL
ncbi:MAG TPA: hypothetical protein VI915_04865 [Thermoplasmata archaeon]|nr:hypothetical protein [Thermoplasmata archaeon]